MVAFSPSSSLTIGPQILSGVDEFGVQWITETVDGWEGSPASTLSVTQKPRGAGGWAGLAYLGSRSMAMAGRAFAPDAAALSAAIDRLNAACAPFDTELTVMESGRERWCMVRRAGDVIPVTTDLSATWSIQVVAPDPRKFSAPLTASTGLPSTTGGLTVPLTVPFSIAATTVSGQVSLTNPGNESGPVVLRIDGPCTGPVITHVGSGLSLVFASSLVLNAGEWLTVDTEARQVLANDQASRNGYVTSRGWFSFVPGENTFTFTAAAYTSGALLTVTATPADQ